MADLSNDGFDAIMDKHLSLAGVDTTDTTTDTGNDTNTGADTQGGNTDTQAAGEDTLSGGAGVDSLGDRVDGRTKQGKEAKTKDTPAADELKAGDIKLQDGTIVRAGAERRHFDNARLFKQEATVLKSDLNTMTQKYTALQEKHTLLVDTTKQIGLEDPQQISGAVRLYKDLAADPVKTVEKLLAELKAKGYSFDGIGGGVDTRAIEAILDRRLNASETVDPKVAQQQQMDQEIEQEVQTFLTQFPDAVTHEAMIANVVNASIEAGQPVDLRTAYFKLKQSSNTHGFDWSKPLGPQIEARKAATAQQQEQKKPITPGRAGVRTASTDNIDPFKTSASDSKDDIIIAAMAEAGINYKR